LTPGKETRDSKTVLVAAALSHETRTTSGDGGRGHVATNVKGASDTYYGETQPARGGGIADREKKVTHLSRGLLFQGP